MENIPPIDNKAPIVSAQGLVKEFKDFWGRSKARAVNDVDFKVNEGEVVGLLGPNGSGKSTIVKMILGLLYPTAGALSVMGRSPRDVKGKKMIGYLPEETYLYKYLTAAETLDFFGSLFNLSAPDRRGRAGQLLEMVGLSHAKNRPVGEFSKGMQRRIGLAQAMINDPAFLILDEPTSGLDPIGCREVKDLILLLKKRGKTVLVVSHLLSDVEDVCDRVVILYGGKIRAQGTLPELLTINERSRITMPLMGPEVTERVLRILRENLSGEEFRIDNPRMTLEEFFLDVVNKAKADSVETSGAANEGRIADYLTGGQAGGEILRELSRTETRPEPASVEEEARAAAEKERELSKTLERLSSERPSPGAAAVEEAAPEAGRRKMEDVNKKLQELLSGPKKDEK